MINQASNLGLNEETTDDYVQNIAFTVWGGEILPSFDLHWGEAQGTFSTSCCRYRKLFRGYTVGRSDYNSHRHSVL